MSSDRFSVDRATAEALLSLLRHAESDVRESGAFEIATQAEVDQFLARNGTAIDSNADNEKLASGLHTARIKVRHGLLFMYLQRNGPNDRMAIQLRLNFAADVLKYGERPSELPHIILVPAHAGTRAIAR